VLEEGDLADEVEAEVVLDVPAESLGEVAHDLALVDAAGGGPPLALELAHTGAEAPGQVLALHPPLHAAEPRVHGLLLGRGRVQEHLDVADEHGDEDEPARDGDDVEHDLHPLRRALQVAERAERHEAPEDREQHPLHAARVRHQHHRPRVRAVLVVVAAAAAAGQARAPGLRVPGPGEPVAAADDTGGGRGAAVVQRRRAGHRAAARAPAGRRRLEALLFQTLAGPLHAEQVPARPHSLQHISTRAERDFV